MIPAPAIMLTYGREVMGLRMESQGPQGALYLPPRKLQPEDICNVISKRWSDSQKFASLWRHLPDRRTWQYPSNKLLLQAIWPAPPHVPVCIHIGHCYECLFQGHLRLHLESLKNDVETEILETRKKPEMDGNTIRMYGVPSASLINVCLQ